MATIDIGKLTFTHKGDYDGSTAYVANDVVYYNGSAYIAKTSTTGNLPTSTAHWNTFATGSGGIWNAGLSLGTGSQQLRVNSGGSALEFFTPTVAAQNVDIINYTTLDATGVNQYVLTTDWTTNNYWKIQLFGQYGMDANQGIKARWRNASGDITSSTYAYIGYYSHATESHNSDTLALSRDLNGGLDNMNINGWGFNSSRKYPDFDIQIIKPDINNRQHMHKRYLNQDNTVYFAHYSEYMWSSDTSVKTGISLTGNNSAKLNNGFIIALGYKYQ